MRIEIDLSKSVQENASDYYALAKKAKKKLDGLGRGEAELEKKIRAQSSKILPEKKLARKRERKWYEKFHWFYTSDGMLAIAGRDAKSNEVVVKKMMEDNDVYFHADIHGAPHTILKTEGKKPSQKSLDETAVFAAVFSKAWSEQLPAVDVYSASPSQVSKKAPTGESIGTGAFMIYGEREWFRKTALEFAIGFRKSGEAVGLFSGPPGAVEANTQFMLRIGLGGESKGDAAKKILGIFKGKIGKNAGISLDDAVSLLPTGGMKIIL